MLRHSIGVYETLDQERKAKTHTVEDSHCDRDEGVIVFEIIRTFVSRVALNVSCNEEHQNERS